VRQTDNVAFLPTATGENLQRILQATKLHPETFAHDYLFPQPVNGPLNYHQRAVAATAGAYFLATYDGVIVIGDQSRLIMREAECQYGLGEWTTLPDFGFHPTNNEDFINDCAKAVNSFTFRIFADYEQSSNVIRSRPERSQSATVTHGNFRKRPSNPIAK
jgi:hypothetical protein